MPDGPSKATEPASREAAEAILAVIELIPPGCVTSYGEVARRAGLPGRARLVGATLRQCDRPVPWHRVLRADGRIAFPAGSDGHRRQCRRLDREGVEVNRGRVDLERYGWDRDLDRQLWGPPAES